jgi:hypothetical protein
LCVYSLSNHNLKGRQTFQTVCQRLVAGN